MKWLQNHAFYNKVCTRSTLNTGWETGAVAQWVEVDDWLQKWHWSHSYHQGSSPARTQYLCFICFLFRRWRWKRGGGGRLSRGWIVWEGEKNCSIQWRKWAFLWQVEPPSQHKWKCYRLRGLTPDRGMSKRRIRRELKQKVAIDQFFSLFIDVVLYMALRC